MLSPHFTVFAERAVRLRVEQISRPTMAVVELSKSSQHQAVGITIFDAAPNTVAGMGRLTRAVAAFNAIMDEAELETVEANLSIAAE